MKYYLFADGQGIFISPVADGAGWNGRGLASPFIHALKQQPLITEMSWPPADISQDAHGVIQKIRTTWLPLAGKLWYILYRVWRGLLSLAERPAPRLLSLCLAMY
jgi:hypothetical protein